MKSSYKSVCFVIVLAGLSGCSSTDETDQLSLLDQQGKAIDGANTAGYQDGSAVAGSEFGGGRDLSFAEMGSEFTDPNNPLSKQTIYFMYDSSQVQQEFIPVIAAHAQYLAAHPNTRLVLEGHADERGSREYNIALGEQRAKAVARMMKVQGVQDRQLQAVSFGEEKPSVSGHDEDAWQMNRRVELVYQGR